MTYGVRLSQNVWKAWIYTSLLIIKRDLNLSRCNFWIQAIKLPVENFGVGHEMKVKRHGDLLPDSIRAIFCGPSNWGKTNSLLALITHPNGLRFENVYIYSK